MTEVELHPNYRKVYLPYTNKLLVSLGWRAVAYRVHCACEKKPGIRSSRLVCLSARASRIRQAVHQHHDGSRQPHHPRHFPFLSFLHCAAHTPPSALHHPNTAVDYRTPRRRRHIAPLPSTSFRNQHTSHHHQHHLRGHDPSSCITTAIPPHSSPWLASLQLPVSLDSCQSQTQLCGHSPCIS